MVKTSRLGGLKDVIIVALGIVGFIVFIYGFVSALYRVFSWMWENDKEATINILLIIIGLGLMYYAKKMIEKEEVVKDVDVVVWFSAGVTDVKLVFDELEIRRIKYKGEYVTLEFSDTEGRKIISIIMMSDETRKEVVKDG